MGQPTSYRTLIKRGECLHKVKGSKHFGYAIEVRNEEEVKEQLELLRTEHHSSRHVCYAFRLGPKLDKYRYSDAGEPSGTAGKPIYGQILSKEITDCLIVVVRYFGGTKLGVGGLIDAYRTTAQQAIEDAGVEVREISKSVEVFFEYDLMGVVMNLLKEFNFSPSSTDFAESCSLKVRVPLDLAPRFESRLTDIYGVEWKELE